MADSCRTSRKGRTKPDDATLWRGSIAKASATARALRNLPGPPPATGGCCAAAHQWRSGASRTPVSAGRERTRLRPRLA
jgi:hypothetical protein